MKEKLRRLTLKNLKEMAHDQKELSDRWLTKQLVASSSYQKANVIATYLSMPHEFNTHYLIEIARRDGKTIVIPKTYAHASMIFVEYDEDALMMSSFGLLEPVSERAIAKKEIDLIHVPGLIFNQRGYRIGYGGGFYDRYLTDFSGQTISTIYACQREEFREERHDVAVNEVLIDEKNKFA